MYLPEPIDPREPETVDRCLLCGEDIVEDETCLMLPGGMICLRCVEEHTHDAHRAERN